MKIDSVLFRLTFTAIAALVAGCDGGNGAADASADDASDAGASTPDATPTCSDAGPAAMVVDCDPSGNCPTIAVTGDPAFVGPGTFHGHADATLSHDPAAADRLWLAYSWLHLVQGVDPDGGAVTMASVENHLARSDDGGATFSFVSNLWPSVAAADPEGTGEMGMFNSETASLVYIESEGTVTWYGAHLRYFLRPITGYNPKYGTSWQVRIAVGASPEALATPPEAILGVSTTASVYQPQARLDELAGLPIDHCAMLNNPTLFVQDQTLYLIVECLAFVGPALDFPNSSTQVFATTPAGAPPTWVWRHVGVLADHSLAVRLGSDTIQQPDVSLAADGTPILIVTPAHADVDVQVGTVGDGCIAVELESIDPPVLRRDCDGSAVIRASILGTQIKACTHAANSNTGIIAGTELATGGNFLLHRSGVHP